MRNIPMTWDTVRQIAMALPGVVESTSYGTPAFRVGKKHITRLHDKLDALVIGIDMDERESLMRDHPDTFFITDHYRDYPAMLVRLSTVTRPQLQSLLEHAWRDVAPKKWIEQYRQTRSSSA